MACCLFVSATASYAALPGFRPLGALGFLEWPGSALCFVVGGAILMLFAHLGVLRVQVRRKTRELESALACIERQTAKLESEVAERARAEEQVRHLAMHDPLTGLANRRLLTDFFEVAAANARRHGHALALLYLDLDHFKPINDAYGHGQGDGVLVEVARRLRESLRRGDVIARVGGDEFVILLTEVRHDQNAQDVAEKILQSLERPHRIGDTFHRVGASIGITYFPDDGERLESLMYRADQAMYRVKDSGKASFLVWRDECETPLPIAGERSRRHAV